MPPNAHWTGQKHLPCPDLKIHGYNMEKVDSDKYLGDILTVTGSNTLNLKDRVGKGIGKINEMISILETISFGYQYFRIDVLLREAMFLNSVLTNSEVWYGLKPCEIKELEDLDRSLLRRALKCPISTVRIFEHPVQCV